MTITKLIFMGRCSPDKRSGAGCQLFYRTTAGHALFTRVAGLLFFLTWRKLAPLVALLAVSFTVPAALPEVAVPESCDETSVNVAHLDLDELESRPDTGLSVPEGATIRYIDVYPQDIYPAYGDKESLHWYESVVDALHPVTFASAIRAQLLFAPGETYSQEVIDETERKLRASSYLYNARIVPVRICGDTVDLAVVTRDLWTLLPTIGFSRSGGDNRTVLGLSDKNFLGTGKELAFSRESEKDTVEYNVNYVDPNLFGSRWRAGFQLADSNNGERQGADLSYPFYRAGAPWSFHLSGFHEIDDRKLYYRNETVNEFDQDVERYELSYGRSAYFDGDWEERFYVGMHSDAREFFATDDTVGPLPEDRVQRYPWLAYEWEANQFLEAFNVNQIQQVEDIPLGWRHYIQVGWSDEEFGATRDQLIFAGESRYRWGDEWRISTVGFDSSLSWGVQENKSENAEFTLYGDYTELNEDRDRAWFVSLEATATENLTLDNQLLLGGSNGLRGYPSNYQVGNRRFLFSLERRFFWDWYPLKTFHVAGVTFFDMGRAWYVNQDNGINGGVLKDVGFGIRVTSSRIRVTRVLHMDLAFPLDKDDPDIDDMQLVLRGRQTF